MDEEGNQIPQYSTGMEFNTYFYEKTYFGVWNERNMPHWTLSGRHNKEHLNVGAYRILNCIHYYEPP